MSSSRSLQKPVLSTTRSNDAMKFAARSELTSALDRPGRSGKRLSGAENAPRGAKSGLIPEGDVRLTANISADLHKKLKIHAVEQGTTIGELIEAWIRELD